MAEVKFGSNLPQTPTPPKEVKVIGQAEGMQKQPLGKRLFHAFFMVSSPKEIGDRLLFKVFVPQMKALMEGLLGKGIHMLFFGDEGLPSSAPSTTSNTSFVNYGSFSSGTQASQLQVRANLDFDMPIMDSQEKALQVIQQLREILAYQGYVQVAQLYTSVSRTPDWTDEYYGWRDLSAAAAVPQVDGRWLVSLPKAVRLN